MPPPRRRYKRISEKKKMREEGKEVRPGKFSANTPGTYRVGQKKVSQIIFAITLSTVIQFSYFLAHIYYRKFATGGCIVSPPNVVCVTTLPCKILTTTFFTLNCIHCCKKSSFYFGSNNCQFKWNNFFKRIVPDEYYLFSSNGYALAAV